MNGSGFAAYVMQRPSHTETAMAMRAALAELSPEVDSLAGVLSWLAERGTGYTLGEPIRIAWRRYRQQGDR